MAQTITIELRVDFDTKNKKIKEPIILEAAKEKAKELLTLAALMADSRPPQISLQCGDFFAETKDIELVDANAT